MEYSDKIEQIRERQLNRILVLLTIVGFFALPVSLSRFLDVGWHPILLVQIFLYLCIIAVAVFRNHLTFSFRSLFVLSIPFLLGVGGLVTWGLTGFGIPALFTFCVLAVIFYGGRAGIIAMVVSVSIIGAIGLAFIYGIFTTDFDPTHYMTSLSFWLNGITFMVLAAGLLGFALGNIHQQTAELVTTLDGKNKELRETNERLQQEMTERIRLERVRYEMGIKLQQSEKMEFLGTLAGGVAHDLNNVLSGVTGYTDLLLLKQQNKEQMSRYLEAVRGSGKKAAAIVQDFLTLARRGVVIRDAVPLNDIVMEYLKSPEHERLMMFHPGLKIDVHLEADLMNIIGSPFHISKTIMNLVSNAAEATPSGGHIIISTQNRTLEDTLSGIDDIEPGEYVTISVEDYGTGIAKEDIKKIFEPFYTKKVMGRSGTGLGMSVVWWTVKDHQGFIDVQSTEGKGTIFTIYLPATRQQLSPKDIPLHIDDYFGKGESILVVDDVDEQRELAMTILRELGYQADIASSGEEAITRIKEKAFDIVFLDMIMDPGIDGLDTLKQILISNPKQRVIITSGISESERVKDAEKLGAVMFLKKPYQLEQLAMLVRQMLQ